MKRKFGIRVNTKYEFLKPVQEKRRVISAMLCIELSGLLQATTNNEIFP